MFKKITRILGLQKKRPLDAATEAVFANLKKGAIAIDCGANVGVVTQRMAEKGATVYAFEPNPYAFKVLQNKFSNRPNVHCFQNGVMDKTTTLKLHLHEKSDEDETYWSTGSSFLAYKSNVLAEKFVEVPVIDLNQFILDLKSRVTLLKLDVEGVEIEILNKLIDKGTYKLIDKLVVETHEKKIPELIVPTDLLKAKIKANGITNIDLNWI